MKPFDRINRVVLAWMALTVAPTGFAAVTALNWDRLPALPPAAGEAKQPGVAGPFAGVQGDTLIVAGGANFPDKLPWDGGAKIWWDDIWILENLSSSAPRWVSDKTFKLPRRLGYGISISTPDGVICAGGHDADRCYADVFLLSWDARTRKIRRTNLPPLPEPLSYMAGALVGTTLYIAGGQTTMKDAVPSSLFWALDLAQRGRSAEFKWSVLPAWPGPTRILPVAAAQRTPRGEEFFLFSGRTPQAGRATTILSDAYAFEPRTRTWRTLPSISDGVRGGLSVTAGSAVAVGESEILLFGGDRGELFRELEAHDLAIAALRVRMVSAPEGERGALEREISERLAAKRRVYDAHPGFARDVLAFDTQREIWRTVGRSPVLPSVTTVAVKYREAILLPSGEVKPGIRTADIIRVVSVGP